MFSVLPLVTMQFQLERATDPVDEAVEPPADEAMADSVALLPVK